METRTCSQLEILTLIRWFHAIRSVGLDVWVMDMGRFTLAPEGTRGTPRAREWADDLMQSWPALINSIPTAITNAASAPIIVTNGMYVVFTPEEDDPPHFTRKPNQTDPEPRANSNTAFKN